MGPTGGWERARASSAARGLAASAVALVLLPVTASAGAAVGWRMDGTGAYPDVEAPVEWSETLNVGWATEMPARSNASPVLVGDRVFVTAEEDLLLAVDAAGGEILWQRHNPVVEAFPGAVAPAVSDEELAALPATVEALRERERELSALRRRAAGTPRDEKSDLRVRELEEQTADLRRRLAAGSVERPVNPSAANGFATPTPVSDGEQVYALFGSGVLAAYDLDGTRRWLRFVDRSVQTDGSAASPLLVGDRVLAAVNDLIALDRETGAFLWRADVPFRPGTPAAFTVDGQGFVVTPSGHCVRVADGAIVASDLGSLDFASPLIRDGVLYMIQREARAFRLPEHAADTLAFEPLWKTRLKGTRYYSSPLVAGGLLYAINRAQILNVLDAATGESLYVKRLRLGWTGHADSVFSSPTLGGDHVYVTGLSGTTAVLRLGRRFEQVASNELEELRSTPVFDGDRMYIRTEGKLYCVSVRGAGGCVEASP